MSELTSVLDTLVPCKSVKFHRDLSYLVISDIHLGHRNTTTKEIVENLDAYFGYYSATHAFTRLDLLFIAGDLFDSALLFTQDEIAVIQGWMYRLMDYCVRHGIKLRILEGTPSHDNFQCRNFLYAAERYGKDLDFKYIETLHIEKIDDIGVSVLYVPDEWSSTTAKTQEQVVTLMKEATLSHVDIAIMHGMFTYQVPELTNASLKHSELFYLDIVKYFINIGHVHTFSTFDRIIAQGSFDRLAHGEESAKGGVLCYLSKDGQHGYVFIENTFAKTYKTINVRHTDIDKALAQVANAVDKLKPESHVRIKAKAKHPILQGLNTFKVSYPFIHFSKLTVEDDETAKIIQEHVDNETDYVPININKENIITLLMGEIIGKYNLDNSQVSLLEKHLNKIK